MPAVRCATPKSATHVCSNLASNGKHLAFAAYSSAVIVKDENAVKGSSAVSNATIIEAEDGALIQQVRWVQLQCTELLVVASSKNLMIYTNGGQRLLHVVTAAGGDAADSPPASFKGIGSCIAGVADYICVGVSTGAVCLVPIPDPQSAAGGSPAFGDSLLSPTSEMPIVDLSANQAPHNDPSRALVCSADAAGQVLVHALEGDGAWQYCCSFTVTTPDETPSMCTSLRMRGAYVYCAYSTGHVRIYDLVSCTIAVQMSAHARWINAIEVHPNGCHFATASEDTTVQIFEMLDGPKVRHSHAVAAPDALLCGVAFSGGIDRTHVSVAAYDVAAVQSWKLE